jgi:protein-S-isoprenylcysteine O-methyltransferase Ste14
MGRTLVLIAAGICYSLFFASFVYLIGFAADLPMLPTTVDKGMAASPQTAVFVDLALIALFGLQHSVMARSGFKAAWTRIIPPALERSVFCLASAVCLGVMYLFWCPIEGSLWTVTDPAARTAIWALFLLGWTILFVATWLLDHFELFGLAQAWRHFRDQAAPIPSFRMPLLYRWVRHPIYTGFLIAFWATPDMTWSHLVLAGGFSIYIFIGIAHEERDLVRQFGETYLKYRGKVGTVLPGLGRH